MYDLTETFKEEDYSWKDFTRDSDLDDCEYDEFNQDEDSEEDEPGIIGVTTDYVKTKFQDVAQICQHLHEIAKGYGV